MPAAERAAAVIDAPVPAFDAVAAGYDASFTDRLLGRWLRGLVQERLEGVFRSGDHILELGCGTGEDALWLARRGVRVTATDASPAMLEVARRKAAAAGVAERVELVRFDLARPDARPGTGEVFDGALSNFGALNCLPDRRPLARALAERVRPGGQVALVVMGPCCPWEVAWHLAHGQPGTAMRRFRAGQQAQVGNGAAVQVWYPSPRRLRAEFGPWFRHRQTIGIGVLLPPSYVSHLVERRARLFSSLRALERRIAPHFPWTWLNDHYLVLLERR